MSSLPSCRYTRLEPSGVGAFAAIAAEEVFVADRADARNVNVPAGQAYAKQLVADARLHVEVQFTPAIREELHGVLPEPGDGGILHVLSDLIAAYPYRRADARH